MKPSAADPHGTIYTFQDFPHLEAHCKVCAETTTIRLGVIKGGCTHIDVVWCDDQIGRP